MLSFSCFRIPLWGLLILGYFLEVHGLGFYLTAVDDSKVTACPKGWLFYVRNCYGLFPDNVTRTEAEEECQSLGRNSHLASILSDTEQAMVINYITTMFPNVGNVWIGLRDRWRLRGWRWEDGSKTKNFYWTSDAPKIFTKSKYCVYMIAAEGYKTWKDTDCSEMYAFLCKMKA